MEQLLPLGTIIYLHQSREKIMIISRGAIYGDDEEEYFDYLGCIYPTGIDKEHTIFFNHDNVDQVIFKGYYDESEERFAKLYYNWQAQTNIVKGKS